MFDLVKFICELVAIFFGLTLLFRLMQVNYYNPLVQRLLDFTEPVVSPVRRLLPAVWRLDTAGLFVLWAIHSLPFVLLGIWTPAIAAWALIASATTLLNLLMYSVILMVIMSWIAPQAMHPAAEVIHQLTAPLMAPFRGLTRGLPLDISPIFVLIGISLLRQLLQLQAARLL